ncbi:hypothetical protein A2701_03995 [Candidatus Amesbacteria bacterium RIFCSPHIGHO2_01_FULL_47_34]|uniref:Uncharacterized protein n=1 Tax=Candidatus Amesbacteria bacterium RIFCSPLOWO2_01_FULL_47_33 TaxID=1797258 RepID=A0A1F4Z1J3_9BACT|nr:MAG: hypothetical protein A2701_03995 [Candidatus Amesbacteria bacterium RIFCSPHIGHO2_01_FULL_47_34]OGD00123.1 MAG: hypothetical protein A2972_01245 [Candidatus Amesbacteria bacterium RIFCSPLOWO2_01_FULL_47_33]
MKEKLWNKLPEKVRKAILIAEGLLVISFLAACQAQGEGPVQVLVVPEGNGGRQSEFGQFDSRNSNGVEGAGEILETIRQGCQDKSGATSIDPRVVMGKIDGSQFTDALCKTEKGAFMLVRSKNSGNGPEGEQVNQYLEAKFKFDSEDPNKIEEVIWSYMKAGGGREVVAEYNPESNIATWNFKGASMDFVPQSDDIFQDWLGGSGVAQAAEPAATEAPVVTVAPQPTEVPLPTPVPTEIPVLLPDISVRPENPYTVEYANGVTLEQVRNWDKGKQLENAPRLDPSWFFGMEKTGSLEAKAVLQVADFNKIMYYDPEDKLQMWVDMETGQVEHVFISEAEENGMKVTVYVPTDNSLTNKENRSFWWDRSEEYDGITADMIRKYVVPWLNLYYNRYEKLTGYGFDNMPFKLTNMSHDQVDRLRKEAEGILKNDLDEFGSIGIDLIPGSRVQFSDDQVLVIRPFKASPGGMWTYGDQWRTEWNDTVISQTEDGTIIIKEKMDNWWLSQGSEWGQEPIGGWMMGLLAEMMPAGAGGGTFINETGNFYTDQRTSNQMFYEFCGDKLENGMKNLGSRDNGRFGILYEKRFVPLFDVFGGPGAWNFRCGVEMVNK